MRASNHRRALAIVFGVMYVFTGETAQASITLTLTHQPPPAAIAGQSLALHAAVATTCTLNCPSIEVILHYVSPDGTEAMLEQLLPPMATSQPVVFDVPGGSVRYPDLRYWIEARQGSTKRRTPQTGMHSVAVSTTLRLRTVDPGGSPVVGAKVIVTPRGGGKSWFAQSDPQGWVTLAVPATDPRIAADEAANKYATLTVHAYDQLPNLSPSQTQTLTVNWGGTSGYINLGEPLLDAADPNLFGTTLTLAPASLTFYGDEVQPPKAGGANDCKKVWQYEVCKWLVETVRFYKNLQSTPNWGADAGMAARVFYNDSVTTMSTWYVGSGLGPSSSGSTYRSQRGPDEERTTAEIDTGFRGPLTGTYCDPFATWADSCWVQLDWIHHRYLERITYENYASGDPIHTYSWSVTPNKWTGGNRNVGVDDAFEAHGERSASRNDCIIQTHNDWSSESIDKSTNYYDITIGGKVLGIIVEIKYVNGHEHATTIRQQWDINEAPPLEEGPMRYYLFVISGMVTSGDPRCPANSADRTWTDSDSFFP